MDFGGKERHIAVGDGQPVVLRGKVCVFVRYGMELKEEKQMDAVEFEMKLSR